MSDKIAVVLCERGSPADAQRDPTCTGWTKCRCGQGVLLRGDESTKVAAGSWFALCMECATDIRAEHPETFDPAKLIRPGKERP